MRRKHRVRAFSRERNCSEDDNARHEDRGERFRFAVTIRMRRVRRPRGKSEPTPNNDRTSNIKRRFNSVGDQGIGVSKNSAENLDDGERDVHDQTEQGESRAGLQTNRSRLRRWHGFGESCYGYKLWRTICEQFLSRAMPALAANAPRATPGSADTNKEVSVGCHAEFIDE